MAKLLPTNLPFAVDEVSPELFNKLIRILELNLGQVDILNTYQVNTTDRDKQNFNTGTIIFNTSTNSLQLWDGFEFVNLSTPFTAKCIVGTATSAVGSVTVTIS
tara:strand:- start:3054 stop:3365 length:312 start_codon:yes stop_codon:yes gene_type:complete